MSGHLTVISARRCGDFDEVARTAPLELARWDGAPAELETEVRIGHDGARLMLVFRCGYDDLHVEPDHPTDHTVDRLWEWDVVEALVSDCSGGVPYREIQVSPLGQWLALSLDGVRVRSPRPWSVRPEIVVDVGQRCFDVSVGLPLDALRTRPSDTPDWSIGLFRIAGRPPLRHYFSHHPTGTAAPDFHRPETWAKLELVGCAASKAKA